MLSSWYSPGAPTLVSFCVRGSYFQMIAGAGPYVPIKMMPEECTSPVRNMFDPVPSGPRSFVSRRGSSA